jgi:hypothetical protein
VTLARPGTVPRRPGWRGVGNEHTLPSMPATRVQGSLRARARRVTAALLVAVQLVALLASFTELRQEPAEPLHPGAGIPSTGAASAFAELGQQRAQHDEATCPACIVRSLHARVEAQALLPTAIVQQADPALPSLTSPALSTSSRSNLSRAPPIVG